MEADGLVKLAVDNLQVGTTGPVWLGVHICLSLTGPKLEIGTNIMGAVGIYWSSGYLGLITMKARSVFLYYH